MAARLNLAAGQQAATRSFCPTTGCWHRVRGPSTMLALILSVCFATCEFAVASNINQKYRTWSGGHAGITLNATGELTIYEAKVPDGFSEGFLRHFWITGGTAGHIDDALVKPWADSAEKGKFIANKCEGFRGHCGHPLTKE